MNFNYDPTKEFLRLAPREKLQNYHEICYKVFVNGSYTREFFKLFGLEINILFKPIYIIEIQVITPTTLSKDESFKEFVLYHKPLGYVLELNFCN